MTSEVHVDSADWLLELAAQLEQGRCFLDFLTVVDRGDAAGLMDVVAHVVDPASNPLSHVLVSTSIDRANPQVASVQSLFAGAAWHEREMAEMFGVAFVGAADLRPLLLSPALGMKPLRKDTVLASRVVRTWPGASDPEDDARSRRGNPSKRRQPPPGVPVDWLQAPKDES